MVLPDNIVKSHQLLAQTILNIFSILLEDGHDDPSPRESTDPITDRNVAQTIETALNEHAANLIKLVEEQQVKNLKNLPSAGGVPCVGDPSDVPSEVSVANVDSEPVVVPAFTDVAEVSEVEVLEQISVNPVDCIFEVPDHHEVVDVRPVEEPFVFAPVCEDLKSKLICCKLQECVTFPDYSTRVVLPPVEKRLDFVLECHSSLQLPKGKA